MEINPYAVPQSDPERPPKLDAPPGRLRRRIALTLAILILIGCPISSGVALIDIESIVVSGLVLSVAALLLIAAAQRQDLRLLWTISFLMLAMSVGCFLTIFILQWSPTDAQIPIGRATVVFALVVQACWIIVASVIRKRDERR